MNRTRLYHVTDSKGKTTKFLSHPEAKSFTKLYPKIDWTIAATWEAK